MPGKHHFRGFKIAKKIGSTMVSIVLVDRKTSLTGVQNSKKNRLAATILHCVSRCQENITYGGSNSPKKIGSPLRGSWTMVSIALVDARKTSLTGVQNSKKIGSPLRGSWTWSPIDARKTSLMGVQNSKKIGSPLRGSWTMLRIVVGSNPPLEKS